MKKSGDVKISGGLATGYRQVNAHSQKILVSLFHATVQYFWLEDSEARPHLASYSMQAGGQASWNGGQRSNIPPGGFICEETIDSRLSPLAPNPEFDPIVGIKIFYPLGFGTHRADKYIVTDRGRHHWNFVAFAAHPATGFK